MAQGEEAHRSPLLCMNVGIAPRVVVETDVRAKGTMSAFLATGVSDLSQVVKNDLRDLEKREAYLEVIVGA